MKKISIFLSAIFALTLSSHATNYYFSSSDGNDSRSSAQAQSPATPWQTLRKLNSLFASLKPGDSVLFKRGDTFFGSINIDASGNSNAPVVLAAYGAGAKPIITGFKTLGNWTSKGGGVYESADVVTSNYLNLVVINDAVQEMGRYPNSDAPYKGFLYLETHDLQNSITDNELTATPNWKGAELVVRAWKSAIDRATITAHAGGTLSAALSYEPHDGFGYFIQNDIRTLDKDGEWYYNNKTHKLSVFFGAAGPANRIVKAAAVDTLISADGMDYVTLSGLSLQGTNEKTVFLRYGTNITVTGCDFLYAGMDALSVRGTTSLQVLNNTFNHTMSNCIEAELNANNWIVRGNTIKNTAMFPGLCQAGTLTGYAIYPKGDNITIEYNSIDSTGYIPIRFAGSNILIKNNFINYFNTIKDDGSAIYSWNGPNNVNRRLIGNIIANGVGAGEGIGKTQGGSTSGFYFDNDVANVEITGNTISGCTKTGIYIHNSYGIKVSNNTLFGNGKQIVMVHDAGAPTSPLRNLNIKNNILFAKSPKQDVSVLSSIKNDLNSIGSVDSNYYCRPTDETFVNSATYVNALGKKISTDYDLKGWQDAFVFDDNSKKTARSVPAYVLNSFVGANKFANGNFASDVKGVYCNSTSSWVSPKLDGGTFQANVSSTNTFWQTIIGVGALSETKNYILRFSAQSSKDTVLYVYLRQASSPYTASTDRKAFKVGPTRKEYEFLFSAPLSQTAASLAFLAYGRGFQFWLDNVQLYEANVTVQDLNQFIRLEYNPTNTDKTVALDAKYFDVKNTSYSGSVTLPPYGSVILMKDPNSASQQSANKAPLVSISSPLANASYNAPATFDITANASDSDGTVSKVEFFDGANLIGTDSAAPYSITWNKADTGTHSLTAKATDNKGTTTLSAAVSIVVIPAPATSVNDTLIAYGSGWKYLDDGSNQETAWRSSSFNDGSWKEGKAALGYAQVGIKTIVGYGADPLNKYITTYFRKTINVSDTSRFSSYTLNIKRDDGAVVYVNGIEVFRTNMPAGAIGYTTRAASSCWDDGKVAQTTQLTISQLRQGINVIAVEVHQRRASNADMNFDMEIIGTPAAKVAAAPAPGVNAAQQAAALPSQSSQALVVNHPDQTLSAKAYPNPANGYFNLSLQSNDGQPVTMRVVNLAGRVIETRAGMTANGTVQFGHNLPAGIYIVQLVQGAQKTEVKLTKL